MPLGWPHQPIEGGRTLTNIDNNAGKALLRDLEDSLRSFELIPGAGSANFLTGRLKSFRVERVTSQMHSETDLFKDRLQKARERSDEVISLLDPDEPDLARAHFVAGRTASLLADWQAAQGHFQQALELGADESLVRYFMAVTFDLDGPEASAAIDELTRLIEIHGDGSEAALEAAKHIHAIRTGTPINTQRSESRCFVATAVYGCAEAPDVMVLRRFRDEILMTKPWTRALVLAYYSVGPRCARFVRPRPRLSSGLRACIFSPLARLLRHVLSAKVARL